jgi:hypothetical protein
MKNNLKEEINRNKSLMGLINEAVTSSNILKSLFKNIVQDDIDNIFAKIETKLGSSLGRSKNFTELINAITSRKITKKYAIEVIIDTLQWSDDEVASLIEKGSPTIISSIESAAKTKETKYELLGVIPELLDLPNGVVNILIKKAGVEFGDPVNVRKLITTFSTEYPELFKKTWFKTLKNEEALVNIINQATKKFKGKNLNVVTGEIKNLLSEANANLEKLAKNNKINAEDKTSIQKALLKTWGVFNPVHFKVLHPEKMDPIKTGGHIASTIVIGYSLYILIKGWIETGSPIVGAGAAVSSEYGKMQRYTGSTGSEEDLRKFLMKQLGYSEEQAKSLKIKYINDYKYKVSANNITVIYKYSEDGTYKRQ